MAKARMATCSLLLLLSLLLVAALPEVPIATAYDYEYGHASILYTSQWNQTDDDVMRAQWVCNDIYNLFAARGHWEIVGWYWGIVDWYWDEYYQEWVPVWGWVPIWNWVPVYGHVENFHAGIYEWRVRSQAQDCEQNHPTTAIFYHGHGGRINITNNLLGPYRYFIYEQASQTQPYPPTTIDDWQDIYNYTLNNHRFVFLWACAQGNEVGGYTSGYNRGMPYAWSHRADLSTDGYQYPDAGNYVFIGFENIWKTLSEWPTPQNNYKYWLVFFYYFATDGYSIKNALNEASKLVWGANFDQYPVPLYRGYWARNPFYPNMGEEWYWSKMRVYGNGDRTLPY